MYSVNLTPDIITKLKQLYCVPYNKFVNIFWSNTYFKDDDAFYKDPKTYYNRLKTWILKILRNGNTVAEKYKYSKNNINGRMYSDGFGFQSLKSNIRNYLFNGSDLYDYDMVNCHFVIFKYLLNDIPLSTPILDKYINNRSDCLNEWGCSKMEVLRMLNLDKYGSDENEYLQLFHKEISPAKIMINVRNVKIADKTDNTFNPISSVMDKILCYYENHFLHKALSLTKTSIILFFDGFVTDTFIPIDDINKLTKKENIKWIIKPFKSNINIEEFLDKNIFDELNVYSFDPDHFRSLIDKCNTNNIDKITSTVCDKIKSQHDDKKIRDSKIKEYKTKISNMLIDECLKYMNRYLITVKGSSMSYIFETRDKYDCVCDYIIYRSRNDCKQNWEKYSFNNIYISKHQIDIINIWFKSHSVRSYDKFINKPGTIFKYENGKFNYYNCWKSWKYRYDKDFIVDETLIQDIIYHYRNIISNGNIEFYTYLICCFKLILMGIKPEVAFNFFSEEGTGKNFAFDYFGNNILGEKNYAYISNIEQLTSKFNSYICNKSFIVVDEVETWAGNTKIANMLKSLITRQFACLEVKGKEPIMVRDYSMLTLLSNNRYFVHVGYNSDRRNNAQEVSAKKIGNKPYFNNLFNKTKLKDTPTVESDLFNKTFFHYIMNFDSSNFDVRNIPQTKYLNELKINATPDFITFINVFVNHVKKNNISEMSITEMYDKYRTFINSYKLDFKYSCCVSFSKKLYREFNIFRTNRKRTKIGSIISFSFDLDTFLKSLNTKYLFDQALLEFDVFQSSNTILDSEDEFDILDE